MTPERWQDIKQILATVLDLAPAERAAYLDRIYAADPSLRDDIDPLVASEKRLRQGFLGDADRAVAARTLATPEVSWVGKRVGPFKVVQQIGAGGMGQVFRAFRADDVYRKEVAIKFVRAAQYDSSLFLRFKNERQILAALDHPNLAKLLDGGTTDEGTPYLVMELIDGQPITEYCVRHNLSIRDKLQLFLQVCAGVHYAHQHLIIHRDIKPQNILVTPDAVPKLLDFGIAKIVEADPAESLPDPTLTGFRALTPRYASPEQIRGEAMTTATDVYSLGVVLYELLTSLSPYDLADSSTQDLPRIVCEKEIQKPSLAVLRIERARETSAVPNRFREVAPEKLRKHLIGDLDNIALMALRKEPARRYASVKDFAEDIRRHLENIPVIARNDTVWYRTSKFVTRHKGGVAASLAVALILIAGIIITTQEARVARRRFNDVRELANSLIFDVHDSVKDLPGSTPSRKLIVDRALKYLNVLAQESAGDLSLQRELATAYERVGSVQGDYLENNLGDFEGTLTSYKKALELRKQIAASSKDWNDRLALAQAYRLVAHQLWANGDPRGARDPIQRAIVISEALNKEQPNNLKVVHEFGFEYEVSGRIGYPGDPAARQKIIEDYRSGLAIGEVELKLQPDAISTLYDYSTGVWEVATMLEPVDPREALNNYQKALEIDQRILQLSPDVRYRRSVAISYGSIASVHDDLGEYSQAVENNMKDLAIYQELVAADPKNALLHQGLAITYMNTAASCSRAGKTSQALDYSSRALELMRPLASSGPKNAFQQGIMAAMFVLRGTILTAAKQPEASWTAIEQGRVVYESLFKAGSMTHVNAAAADVKLAEALASGGHDREAAQHFHDALTILDPLVPVQPPDLDALYAAADSYSGLGELSLKAAQQHSLSPDRRKVAWTDARSWFLKSQETWHRIEHPNHTAPNSFQVGDPAIVAKELKLAEAALANLR
jgi:eukaryotic-like serine/threonine-protein kinase